LLGRIDVSLPLLLAAGFAVLNLVVVVTLLPETHPPQARLPLPRHWELQPFGQLQRVFANPRVRRLCAAFFLFFLGFSGFTALLVLYFKQVFGWGPGLSAGAFLVVGVVATVVQGGLIGPLVQRLGEWRLTQIGLGGVMAGFLLVPLAEPQNAVPVVFTAVALLALGTGLVTPCLRSLVSRRLDDSGQGAALGSLQGLQSLASFLGPPLAGLAYETIGRRSPFWLGILLMAVVVWLVAAGSHSGSQRQAEATP
jgi:predicted MFS family arabinose efflux permease